MAEEPAGPPKSRTETERDEAHRQYNEAFDLIDRARQKSPDWPEPPPRYDEEKLHHLNTEWDILASPPKRPDGLKGPVFDALWPVLEPILKQQREFNSNIVNHLNRNIEPHRQANDALAQIVPGLREGFNALCLFEHLTVHFLQLITPFVDTRERGVREALDELRNVAEVAQRAAAMARREIERMGTAGAPSSAPALAASPALPAQTEAFKYVGFEDRFRGSEDEIRRRLADYVPYFAGASNVLDVGCGRGEFLDLLKQAGVSARGLDINPEMVEVCRARGLDAVAGDALNYLNGVPDESLGGLLAIQVVEHLEPAYLQRFLQAAFYKLRPGATMVLETINPACWVAFFESYIRDLTHVRPIHPETLQYLLHASGFSSVNVVFRAPIAEEARLQKVKPSVERFSESGAAADPLSDLVTAFNRNMDRLNSHMFTFQDFAAVAKRS